MVVLLIDLFPENEKTLRRLADLYSTSGDMV